MSRTPHSRDGWERIGEGLERRVTQGRAMTITRYRFGSGGRFPLHRHDQEQLACVLWGGIVFTVENVEHHLTEGVTLLIESAKAHGAVADPGGAEVLSVVAPARSSVHHLEIVE